MGEQSQGNSAAFQHLYASGIAKHGQHLAGVAVSQDAKGRD